MQLHLNGILNGSIDLSQPNDQTLGITILVAQQEREGTSRPTMETLVAAEARRVKPGNPNGYAAQRRAVNGGGALRTSVSANADRFALTATRRCAPWPAN
jgi:DNA invertase Pin-like site-specific DNA recombinase